MKKGLVVLVLLVLILSLGCGGGGSSSNSKTKSIVMVKVMDEESKTPLKDASVEMNGISGKTNSSGELSFNDVEEGPYTINISKDGFASKSQDIEVIKGKDQTVEIALTKSSQTSTAEKLKDLKDLKSYMFTLKTIRTDGKLQSTIVAKVEDSGNKEQLISKDENGKVEEEIYVVGNKGVIITSGSRSELDAATARQYIEAVTAIGQNFFEGFKNNYNDYVVNPSLYTTWKTSNDTQNGYSTTKIEYTIHMTDVGEAVYTGWVINKGDYKGYTTKLFIKTSGNSKDNENSDVNTFEINITNIGDSFGIKLPE